MQRNFGSVTFDRCAAVFFLGQLPTLKGPAFIEWHFHFYVRGGEGGGHISLKNCGFSL